MRYFLFLVLLMCMSSNSQAQSPQILHGDLSNKAFVGYDNGYPVFYTITDEYGLYIATRLGRDSLNIEKFRESKLSVWSFEKQLRLLWVNNEIEIYTRLLALGSDERYRDFFIVTENRVDTVFVALNGFYQSGYEPFVITNDRKTLFAVQPSGYQDENRGWYYDNIMKIDLTKRPLTVEKLPITGIELHLRDNFLYYKGGCGDIENAILRVEIGKWDMIDKLAIHTGFWFVYDNILYSEISGYRWQDEWFDGNRFIAYSLSERASAIVSRQRPRFSDWYPILFEGEYYNPFSGGLYKIPIPIITEFPHRQTIPPQRR